MSAAVHPLLMLIYKIMTTPQWEEFQKLGTFAGAPIDLADGYIHFSTETQMAETAAKHFAGQTDLVLAWCDDAQFGDALKWEVSRGGDKFPHLYTTLTIEHVTGKTDLPLIDGTHQFPESI